jgi:cardiolipin synthase
MKEILERSIPMPEFSQQIPKKKLLQQSRRGLLRIVFSRTVIAVLLLLLNGFLLFSLLFELFEGITLVFGGLSLATAVMLIVILNSDDDPAFKLSWCIVVAVLPLFGIVLYTFVRFDLGSRLSKKLLEHSIRSGLPYIADSARTCAALEQEDPDAAALACYLRQYANAQVYDSTEVHYFPLGEDKFQEMLRQMEQAKHFIFLEYFIIHPGRMWGSILEVLSRKAQEGVEVRVLYDGMNAFANLPYDYPKQLERLGIHCKVFSPVRPFVSTHYNNRDHRKILVIDGHTAFTGGINLQDRYINEEEVFGHWKDTAVMVQGNAAQGFTAMFLQMWNATEREPVYEPYLQTRPMASATGYVIPYGENPTGKERVAKSVYLHILNSVRQYVYIMTPYLILDREMTNALQFAAKRGVDVRIVLPHIPDKRTAFALAKSHYRELTDAGVKIYEYTPGFVHAKVFLSDDICGTVGSINLDYRSLYLHYECAAYLYKVPALSDIKADFEDTMAKSQRITLEDVKKQSLLSRIAAALLKVAAPLM